jgi:hypothetical protein
MDDTASPEQVPNRGTPDILPFLELPRELRDQVSATANIPTQASAIQTSDHARSTTMPLASRTSAATGPFVSSAAT